MRFHELVVRLELDNDDRTDPEFLENYIYNVLYNRFARDADEYGTAPWPSRLTVTHMAEGYTGKEEK